MLSLQKKINFFFTYKITSLLRVKTKHGHDFLLYFLHEFFLNFIIDRYVNYFTLHPSIHQFTDSFIHAFTCSLHSTSLPHNSLIHLFSSFFYSIHSFTYLFLPIFWCSYCCYCPCYHYPCHCFSSLHPMLWLPPLRNFSYGGLLCYHCLHRCSCCSCILKIVAWPDLHFFFGGEGFWQLKVKLRRILALGVNLG